MGRKRRKSERLDNAPADIIGFAQSLHSCQAAAKSGRFQPMLPGLDNRRIPRLDNVRVAFPLNDGVERALREPPLVGSGDVDRDLAVT
jgi:hypothetical protein